MSLISTYSRYASPGGTYYRTGTYRRASSQKPSEKQESRQEPASSKNQNVNSGKAQEAPSGKQSFLGSLLPAGIDAGDLLLAAMLFFLYIESKDEDFLIILIVVGFSIFRKKEDK